MKTLLLTISLTGIALVSLLFLFQRSLLFPIPPGVLPLSLPSHVEKIVLSEGHALLLKTTISTGRSPVIIYTHGNAELAHWSIPSFKDLTDAGYHVLLVEYPGYAGSMGSPSSTTIETAVLEAYDEVTRRKDVDPGQTVAYGRSIGGGPACILAQQRMVASLILESTFSSLGALVREQGFPALLLRDSFENEKIVAELDVPVLIYHGTEDSLIPFAHAQRLHSAAKNSTLITATCGHNDCPRPWGEIESFIGSSLELAFREH